MADSTYRLFERDTCLQPTGHCFFSILPESLKTERVSVDSSAPPEETVAWMLTDHDAVAVRQEWTTRRIYTDRKLCGVPELMSVILIRQPRRSAVIVPHSDPRSRQEKTDVLYL
ncbi:uncharacterized protein MCYG_01285 [Microsporum canis CBS 113480]|uniref:Uncharacterized protein n=1 Tax=Arthroderma otae (strain ATCC MYA-4605 / CBS 113480) TaxID=554155 RepID=C5FES3_ARTOC|nr:uncharacterized protein MCYG_01285 [Microsporum canis CBS 113480]EEQ28397.1 predicted protein [Microsporum canis CBS 113480]